MPGAHSDDEDHAWSSHHHQLPNPSPHAARLLRWAIGGWILVAVVVALAMWPDGVSGSSFGDEKRVDAAVQQIEVGPCAGTAVEDLIECRKVTVQVVGPDDARTTTVLELPITPTGKAPAVGDGLRLIEVRNIDGTRSYQFADYQRGGSLTALFALFAIAVVALGGWRGLGALAGLIVSVIVLVVFMLPALLDGRPPVLVAIVGASFIAVVSLYLAHGPGAGSNVALLSTFAALSLTGILAWLFVRVGNFTGLTDESSFYLEALGVRIDPRGLVLAGVVIGSLGVLDDVTVTQVSAVGELRRAQPTAAPSAIYRAALRIGRDHISSTVNTLFLAYAGAALPLLLLFTQIGAPVADVATREVVAVEVMRTLVGSIGLVASVPIATALATWAVTVSRADDDGEASAAAV